MKATSICVCYAEGKVVATIEVPTDPVELARFRIPWRRNLKRVGHEAAALSPWLQLTLLKLGLPAVRLETRHLRATMEGHARLGAYRADRLVPRGPREERR
jgi:hypothetical protein